MTENRYVHGSTDEREIARLEKQARFVSRFSMPSFNAPPGSRVLDLATGVGATAGQLLERFPGILLVGVDLNPNQLMAAARNHPEARYVRANATQLPFPDETFDRIYCTWLLEHVSDPLPVLKETRRVLKRGGFCQFIEVDNSTFKTSPPEEAVDSVMDALNRTQIEGGGDPFIGAKLESLFVQCGFSQYEVRSLPMLGDATNPEFYEAFTVEFAEIFEGLDETVAPEMTPKLQRAATRLRKRALEPNTALHYAPVRALGVR